MDKSSTSVTVLLFLMQLPFFGHALFEYICEEKQLYKPYVHIYRHRKGPRIADLRPGFYDMSEYTNVYVCINGLAFLYFAKTTTTTEVFEAPRLKKYAHTCEMYNVQPREGSATVVEITLRLRGVLLLGNPQDYRQPFVQKFTAPYYFAKDQLNSHLPNDTGYEPQPPMYMNASSVVIIGQSECGLLKGRKNTVIKIRPHVFPTEQPTAEKTSETTHFCKIGYLHLLESATTPPSGPIPADDVRNPALALVEDERIKAGKCVNLNPRSFQVNEYAATYKMLSDNVEKINSEIGAKKDEILNKYNAGADAELKELDEEKIKLDEKIEKEKKEKRPKDLKKMQRQMERLELRIKIETGKKEAFQSDMTKLSDELSALDKLKGEADPDGSNGAEARTDRESYEKVLVECNEMDTRKPPPPQTEIDAKKLECETARRKARDSARKFEYALSEYEVGVMRLKKLAERVEHTKIFIASPKHPTIGGAKKGIANLNPQGSPNVVITAKEENCEKLPEVEGDEGECKKGKPEKEYTCKIFKSSLGTYDPWTAPPAASNQSGNATSGTNGTTGTNNTSSSSNVNGAERTDLWKREVLDLIGEIFSTACDRIRNVKKFTKIINRLMGFYLTNDDVFNMSPNPLTDTCINYRFTTALKSGQGGQINMNFKEEKQFWTTLKFVLKECKMEGRRLAFRENATNSGVFKFIKNHGSNQSKDVEVLRHEEQADVEYSYNWPIDMNWKMFVTVMGVCMSGWETKIPLISSRFFALYTEDFLIPLRETWINPKDNIIFQFISSEFYNAHTEYWMDMCMESSFIYAGERDYRPPRSLMVNCHSEHNYFVNGVFSKTGDAKTG